MEQSYCCKESYGCVSSRHRCIDLFHRPLQYIRLYYFEYTQGIVWIFEYFIINNYVFHRDLEYS